MTLVVDCSVALKWVLEEEGRDAALSLIGKSLAAPDFLKLECANVLALKARRGVITPIKAQRSLEAISSVEGMVWRSTAVFVDRAQQLALELEQTAYDCLYLAMAMQDDAVLICDDRRFCDAVERHGVYGSRVKRLLG